ncbi:MAG: hypothetical protein WCH34_05000 [Bacteroidota bacterium]
MIAIADSGSTKTDWAIIDQNGMVKRVQTSGLNPYFLNENSMLDVLEKDLLPFIDHKAIKKVYFYGAGCAAQDKSALVSNVLSTFFINAIFDVSTDITGVLNAIDSKAEGIAAILGTGANSCKFSGRKLIQQAPSLGYILGDEGSGAYIGKMFIKAYLSGKLPESLRLAFEQKHYVSRELLLDNIYRRNFPNRYLASFCTWIAEYSSEESIDSLIKNSFDGFFRNYITIYPDYSSMPLYISGSVAFYFSDQLKFIAHQYQMKILEINISPIEGLIKFHLKEL